MSSYYKCSLFEKKVKDYSNFNFLQDEIILKNILNEGKAEFEITKVEYRCKYKQKLSIDPSKPLAIIPIKDNIDLLTFTLKNLQQFNVFKYLNFIIVDDRSTTSIENVCKDYPVNYLRVDNEKGFNFSTLNNIAAKIAYENKVEEIILWNSDLWVDNEEIIPILVKLHKENSSTISGTKLLYPTFSWNGVEASENIKSIFPNKKDNYRGTIQFGGSTFSFNANLLTYFPNHFCRFKEKDYYLSNCDKLDVFVTGAFQIIDLDWFIEIGGLNPSMSKVFQDVDLCLRAVEQDKKVYYFGKNKHLLHDESVQLNEKRFDNQYKSDHIIYQKIWNYKKFTIDIQKFGV